MLALAAVVGVVVALASGSGSHQAIAYVTGGVSSVPDVRIADLSGSGARSLGPGTHPLLSPDGSIVAASSSGPVGPALTLYATSGSGARRIGDASRATALATTWSPDSRYLAAILTSANPADDSGSGLVVIDSRTLHVQVVARGPIYGASFAPDGSDRIVYSSASSATISSPVDLHVVGPGGSGATQLTHDGRSLNPVWGRSGIAFDREQLRPAALPAYQVWLMAVDGSRLIQLTNLNAPPLFNGLVPLGFSDGNRLLAQYEGQNTSDAWVIDIGTRQVRQILIDGQPVTAAAVARRGGTALVDLGGYPNPPDQGRIEELPLAGGRAHLLIAHGSQPSWNF